MMLNQLARFEPVLKLIREVGPGRVLDVGSGTAGVSRWLEDPWPVTSVDSSFDDYGAVTRPHADGVDRLLADARDLPFEDGAFPVAVAVDLLEHLPGADRPGLLAELARVTGTRLIVACPTGAPALEADRHLARGYARRGKPAPGWLNEHLENGFPDGGAVATELERFGDVRMLGNENVAAHARVVRLESYPLGYYATTLLAWLLSPSAKQEVFGHGAASRVLRVIRGRDRAPIYRTIAVVDRAPVEASAIKPASTFV